jgi:hypothetical protein
MPLTREALQSKANPPQENACAVKLVRDRLSPAEQTVLDEAFALPHTKLSAQSIRDLLRDEAGVPEDLLPRVRQIQNHRGRRESCKCPR